MKIEILDTQETKNGTKHLIFFWSSSISTYGYIWGEQLEAIKGKITLEQGIETKPNLYTKTNTIKNNLYFNTYWIDLLNQPYGNGKSNVLCFKKYPLLTILLDDKTKIIHNKKSVVNAKNISSFRNFSLKSKHSHSVVNKLTNISTTDELVTLFFGPVENKKNQLSLKKILLENFIENNKSYIDINFTFLRTILFLRKRFSTEFLIEVFSSSKYKRLLKSKLYERFLYSIISSDEKEVQDKVLKFCFLKEGCDSEEKAFNELLRFNVPSNHLLFFSEMMGEPFDHFKPKIKDDALYFMNNLSRSWGRIKNKNFKLPFVKEENFSWLKTIDGKKIKEYSFEVPKDYRTLVSWSEKMRNCLGNSNAEDTYFYLGLIGVFKNNELLWVLSVKTSGDISQFEGFKNSTPSSEEKSLVLKILSDLSKTTVKMRSDF